MMKRIFLSLTGALSLLTGSLAAVDYVYAVPAPFVGYEVPIFYHIVGNVFPVDGMVQIEDESQWLVSESDMRELLSWRQGDFVVITPNRSWWSNDYNYCMTNQATRTYVRVNLINGPRHASAHHITGMDLNSAYKRSIFVDGKLYWAISEEDFDTVDGWEVGDTIIVGTNDAWFTNYDTILIDVETNTYAKARRM
jgi:hypothetical protein